MSYDPNRKPFPRGYFLDRFRKKTHIHPLERQHYEAYFQSINPDGFHHDLGAQDVFLDNLGLLTASQVLPKGGPKWRRYFGAINYLLLRWELLKRQVVRKRPYWGQYFNAKTRQANAGEPRSIIRFMADRNWAEILLSDFAVHGEMDNRMRNAPCIGILPSDEPVWMRIDDSFENAVGDLRGLLGSSGLLTYDEWSPDLFVLESAEVRLDGLLEAELPTPVLGGVLLPETYDERITSLRILDPKHATPDLPLRVGLDRTSLAIYRNVLGDQDRYCTCAAHAFSVGLGVLIQRQSARKTRPRPSPAWVHFSSGRDVEGGRSLKAIVAVLEERLPCEEHVLPYPESMLRYKGQGAVPEKWETGLIRESSARLTSKFGPAYVRRLRPDDISGIKTHLAAGWVVVIATHLTDEIDDPSFNRLGLPLSPLLGQKRIEDAHAWLLVGYDHVDGNSQWKYQGRFIALNSWGQGWPSVPAHGPGICSLPFAMLLTECFEAYAMRLREMRDIP